MIAPLWNGPNILRVLLSIMKVSSPFFAALNLIVYPVVSLAELRVVFACNFRGNLWTSRPLKFEDALSRGPTMPENTRLRQLFLSELLTFCLIQRQLDLI